MKAVVIGGNGQLGMDVAAGFAAACHEVVSFSHSEVEVSDAGSVSRALKLHRPDVVINTAAMHNVEACQQQPEEAFRVNVLGPKHLAETCAELSAMLVHISTDYVFGGEKRTPYVETDEPRPLNTYGETKLAGEQYALGGGAKAAVVRTSAIYGSNPCRAKKSDNFVKLMLRLGVERGSVKVVADEFVSPTYTVDIARQILAIVEAKAEGLFHATSQGECSWNEFARAIFEEANIPVKVELATSADFPAKVPRPAYSVLDNKALRDRGLDVMQPWRDALRRYVRTLATAQPR